MVMMMVFVLSLAKSLRYLTMMQEVSESRPEVGSSSIITCGSEISSYAIEVLFFSPPEMPLINAPPTRVSRQFQSFKFLVSRSMASTFSVSLAFSLRSAANRKVSLTVKVCMKRSFCMTQLAKSPKCSYQYAKLLAFISPCWFQSGTLQARMFRRVVLPAPEAPIIAVASPALKIPEMLFSNNFLVVLRRQGVPMVSRTGASTVQLIFLNVISIPVLALASDDLLSTVTLFIMRWLIQKCLIIDYYGSNETKLKMKSNKTAFEALNDTFWFVFNYFSKY